MEKKTRWIFDLDNTLIYTDEDSLKQHQYLTLTPDHKLPLFTLFKKIRNAGEEVIILTNRHPILRTTIADYTGISPDHVICRDYNLENKEAPQGKALDEFLRLMSIEKTRKLNSMASRASQVYFFDDMAHMYKKKPLKQKLNKKIRIFSVTKSSITEAKKLWQRYNGK